jgi:hypothetical protein
LRGVLGHGSAAGGATSAGAKYEWLGGESLKCDVAGCGAKHSETRLCNTLTLAIRKQQKACPRDPNTNTNTNRTRTRTLPRTLPYPEP